MTLSMLQVKVKALKRLIKEREYNKEEIEANKKNIEEMKKNGEDEYEIKSQMKILDESYRMTVELDNLIFNHSNVLKEFLKGYKQDEDTTEANEILASLKH